jgi:hypothetical protein
MFRKVLVLPAGADPNQPALLRAASCAGRITELAVFDVAYEPMLEGYMGNTAIHEPLRARVLAEWQERAAALAKALEAKGFETQERDPLHRRRGSCRARRTKCSARWSNGARRTSS